MPGSKAVSGKMGIKSGFRSLLVRAPEETVATLDLPGLHMASRATGAFDYIHLFVRTQKELDTKIPSLKAHLRPAGMLWVSWPKAGQQETDLNLKTVIRIGYDHGLVESKTISIDATWSAIKFTHPKKGEAL